MRCLRLCGWRLSPRELARWHEAGGGGFVGRVLKLLGDRQLRDSDGLPRSGKVCCDPTGSWGFAGMTKAGLPRRVAEALQVPPQGKNSTKGEAIMAMKLGLISLMVVNLVIAPLCWAGADAIPPGEAGAKAALEKSPRHHEWVKIAVPGTDLKLNSFVAYPERTDQAPVVIVIHEVYGLTDWVRAVADQLAAEDFLAIAPDMLSGRGPGGGGTETFAGRDDVVKAVRELTPAQVVAMLDAVRTFGGGLPAATQKFATVGFCWGGAQSFDYATSQPSLGAAVVYYGTPPPPDGLATLRAPVLGLYGEDDARVTTTVGPTEEKTRELGKVYLTHIYKGAGHGFLRAQEERNGANLEASRQAWPITIEFLRKNLESDFSSQGK
jgi:carboxymethylenebutenolidase